MKIAAHTIVKNEDKFLWFAITSIADFVDEIVVWDTGSTDNTLKIIKDLQIKYGKKISFERKLINDPKKVTEIRQQMLSQNKADWILMVDGDEVWWRERIESLTNFIREKGNSYDSCVVHYQNVVGDFYHFQDESYGEYQIDGQKGFLTIRAFNAKIKGLVYKKDYPLEGLFDSKGVILQEMNAKRRFHLEGPSYLHMTHLERSTQVKNKKYKYQNGLPLPLDYFYPEGFFEKYPSIVSFPWKKRTTSYKLKALLYDMLRKLK